MAVLTIKDMLNIVAFSASLPLKARIRDAGAAANRTVLVIGAGVSGLAAGSLLRSYGYQVKVVEARERVGGRVWTDRSWAGAPLDLGASWIHGIDDNPVARLAEHLGIETVVYDVANPVDHAVYDALGARLSSMQVKRLTELVEQATCLLGSASQNGNSLLSARDAIEHVVASIDASSFERLAVLEILGRELEDNFAADPQSISAWGINEGKAFGGHEVVFPRGYMELAEMLAGGLDVQLGHRVTRIEYNTTGVRVYTSKGEFRGDVAIVTLPLGVLKEDLVMFSPALPSQKKDAIHRLGMGTYNKVLLMFPEVFWGQASIVSHLHTRNGLWSNWYALNKYMKKPVLCALQGGTPALLLEKMSDQDIREDAMAHLRMLFGSSIPSPIEIRVTRWNSDPFARGSYSFPKVGALQSDRFELATPVHETLLFAGEATHADCSGTVHGALLSGWREACRVLGKRMA
ncbi:TPA: NAD(P)-binding protein [Pseudomonas aeruginosa]|uniref:flavin monoamine oxidase family protein n=1 Tax=Pseudomonas paraeruginosa TaxID=2994495 RepID=UPI00374A608D|nr:NAD(P)-binding protein [Pseudomonas aeruginosa]